MYVIASIDTEMKKDSISAAEAGLLIQRVMKWRVILMEMKSMAEIDLEDS